MSWGETAQFSLTLMLNKEKSKVLFASVDRNFADVLLSFLTIPMIYIIRLLQIHCRPEAPTIGSIETLDAALRKMDEVYFGGWEVKMMLLYPGSSLDYEERSKLKLDIVGSCEICRTTYTYSCGHCLGSTFMVSLHDNTAICSGCEFTMDDPIYVKNSLRGDQARGDAEVLGKQTIFLITDDMRILPYETVRSLGQSLETLGIADDIRGESRDVKVSFKEITDLLKLMLYSAAPLTDLFLHDGKVVHLRSEPLSLWVPQLKKEENCSSSNSKKMKITVVVQKSSNKFLFVQAEKDFVDFLFSLLSIPLGQVERLLNANSGLGSFDNLYRNIMDLDAQKCLKSVDTKDALLNPKLPYTHLSNDLFSLEKIAKPKLFCHRLKNDHRKCSWSFSSSLSSSNFECHEVSVIDPKSQLGTCISNKMYLVTDDLTVTRFTQSSFSALMALDVPFTDIEERDINIGLEEALSILKASLTSTCALTKGLKLNCTAPLKQPKQNTETPFSAQCKLLLVCLVSSLTAFSYV